MRILLYNPYNRVTRNFMPHLWMLLLQALTPPGHEALLVDGNAQPMDENCAIRPRPKRRLGWYRPMVF
jgi:hypothetical protein